MKGKPLLLKLFRSNRHQEAALPDAIDYDRVRVTPDGRMTRADAATFIGRSPKTLAMWAVGKTGPTPIRVGGRIFYRLDDLKRFVGASELEAA